MLLSIKYLISPELLRGGGRDCTFLFKIMEPAKLDIDGYLVGFRRIISYVYTSFGIPCASLLLYKGFATFGIYFAFLVIFFPSLPGSSLGFWWWLRHSLPDFDVLIACNGYAIEICSNTSFSYALVLAQLKQCATELL